MKFTLFWLDGTKITVEGQNIETAMNNAGYGAGSLRALDFHIQGDSDEYVFDKKSHRWAWTEEKKNSLGIDNHLTTNRG